MLKVNEIFGPTFQGEGSATGQQCMFLRLANCNLQCTWCDTPYTWAFTDEKAAATESGKKYSRSENIIEMTDEQILAEMYRQCHSFYQRRMIIVVSGGEPLLQAAALAPLARQLAALGHHVHIETAGTLYPTAGLHEAVSQYNVSPKLAHSGNPKARRYKPDVLRWFANKENAWFKFVVRDKHDADFVDVIVEDCLILRRRTMLMPEGTTVQKNLDVAREIADTALERGYGLSFRTHILLWPHIERGR